MKSIENYIENHNKKKILKNTTIRKNSEKSRKFGRIRKARKRSEKLRKFGSFPPNSEDLATLREGD